MVAARYGLALRPSNPRAIGAHRSFADFLATASGRTLAGAREAWCPREDPPGADRPGERRSVMHSRMFAGCGPHAHGSYEERGCGCESHTHHHRHFSSPSAEGGGFGVRRPLRFLAWRLQLSETQVTEMARILNELKTERAQAEVDERRALTAFADAVTGRRST